MDEINNIANARLLELAITGDVGAAEMLGFDLADATVILVAALEGLGDFASMDDETKRTIRLIVAAEQAIATFEG